MSIESLENIVNFLSSCGVTLPTTYFYEGKITNHLIKKYKNYRKEEHKIEKANTIAEMIELVQRINFKPKPSEEYKRRIVSEYESLYFAFIAEIKKGGVQYKVIRPNNENVVILADSLEAKYAFLKALSEKVEMWDNGELKKYNIDFELLVVATMLYYNNITMETRIIRYFFTENIYKNFCIEALTLKNNTPEVNEYMNKLNSHNKNAEATR